MKDLEELKTCKRLIIGKVGADGGCGQIHIGMWDGSVIWSFGGGWDHVSVSPFKHRIIPTWEDMQRLKEIFFRDDEAVIQIHPVKSEYVNNMPNCLHLWRYQGDMPLPPAWMVGVRKGETLADALKIAEEEKDVVMGGRPMNREFKVAEDEYKGYWMNACEGIPLPGVPLIVTVWDSIRNRRELRYPVYYRKGNFDNEFGYYLCGNEDYRLDDELSKVLAWTLFPEVWEGDSL